MSERTADATDDGPGEGLELVSGWGLTPVSASHVVHAATRDDLASAAKGAGPRGIIPRGLGRAYGDSAMNAGGTVLVSTEVSGLLELDEQTGLARVLAGTSLDALMREVVPRGWFVPVTPGTRYITIGGAIAADVHGKDHHASGCFGSHVRSMVLALPDGTTLTLTPETHPEEFWATCGGMGLTGTILEATIALYPIETSRLVVDSDRVPDLDAALTTLTEGGTHHRYSVAWVDLLAKGRSLGRSVLTQGSFAPLDALPTGRRRSDPLAYDPIEPVPMPPLPSGLINRLSMRAFNELWFRKAPRQRRGELQSITKFFYPLDMAGRWNRMYGHRGFLQWQFMIPFGAEETLREIIETLAQGDDAPSCLTVLKYFGESDPGPLSFPGPGWTFALDVPGGCHGLGPVLDRLDRRVADVGGRLYFAKESRMRPELVPVMYPRLDEWRAVRDRLDPDRQMVSDLARRLCLLG